MAKIWFDFETYSEVDIKTRGGYAYAHDDSTNVVCLGWAIDDGPVNLWTPRDPDPWELLDAVKSGGKLIAHNMKFDYRIWMQKMVVDFGWPSLKLDNCIDSQALCATYGLPLSLGKACKAMGISEQKEAIGNALIKTLCTPNKKGGQPLWHDPVYQFKFKQFFEYCKQDIRAMRQLVQTLPRDHLIPQEHEIWKLTFLMNENGLPVAYDEAVAIREYLDDYIETAMAEVDIITNGAIQSITQTVKMRQWIHEQGYKIPDTTAKTVELALKDEGCTGAVRRLLELREHLGASSVAKFKKIIAQAVPDENGQYWVHDNLEFHGAGPGRWSGRGFQMQNLPRFKHKDPEPWIVKFVNNEKMDNPVLAAKGLIRPIIKAPLDWLLMVLDYDSIENVLLHWLADDLQTLEDFRNNIDQYCIMAEARYGVPYADIKAGASEGDPEMSGMRQMGKVIILGCGFGMGWETFIRTAQDQFGMHVEEHEARMAVSAYREKFELVVKLWRKLKTAAAICVNTGRRQTVGRITFGLAVVNDIPWLAMRLPSGKCVYYCKPRVDQRTIPGYEEMGPVPTVTHLGRHPKTGQWVRLALIPGRITENAVQGSARETMAQGLINTRDRMPEVKLLGTVHDEGVGAIRKADFTEDSLPTFNYHLCDIPWAKDCPITASGYVGTRYKKD